ncbi:MAG: hypothetical protein D6813_05625 [Calditrichaeota bacterium]|nr:MAG: hypothetical protein D6813_05625 [Calditrichota bacterium]
MNQKSFLQQLKQLYKGFYLKAPVGNNAIHFWQRKNKQIYVAPLIESTPGQLQTGDEIAFSTMENDQEINACGLKHFVYFSRNNRSVFIFDNHNHAFCFWSWGLINRMIPPETLLIHVDSHTDMLNPPFYLVEEDLQTGELQTFFDYTNYVLNIATFIKPALKLKIFSDILVIDPHLILPDSIPKTYVLDLDMDIFANTQPEQIEERLQKLIRLLAGAQFITIATSPGFMDQELAITLIQKLFNILFLQ